MSAQSSDTGHEAPDDHQALIEQFFANLQQHETANDQSICWSPGNKTLQTSSDIQQFFLGTGEDILTRICQAIENARYEVRIVTCFWAKSSSQERLASCLEALARRARAQERLVNVSICFSSLSLWQKLTHTASPEGQVYPPETLPMTFGLPSHETLLEEGSDGPIGVQLKIKSIFVRPMSVMHPKFIIIDRERAFLPSCNISWENWFEGCIELRGHVLRPFLQFYQAIWEYHRPPVESPTVDRDDPLALPSEGYDVPKTPMNGTSLDLKSVPTLFLPSPHHPDPHFRPTCLLSAPEPPPTPLNTFLLILIANAREKVYLQTPNLTSPPVLEALIDALSRGVDISIVTSSRMMVLEQLLTAGTVTEICVRTLIRRYKALTSRYESRRRNIRAVEEASNVPGRLSIRYFEPDLSRGFGSEPVKSHLKLTIVDDRIVVLGSGNMDRASWYTSQELGVAFFSVKLAREVKGTVDKALEGRLGGDQV